MHCENARELLDKTDPHETVAADRELARHLRGCGACREYGRDRRLVMLMASLPVREPAPGFENRVLARVPGKRPASNTRLHVRWALAAAASMVLAVFVTLQFYPDGVGESYEPVAAPVTVSLPPHQVGTVDILLASPREMVGAQITVRLDDSLELDGYSGVRDLQWHTTLKAGSNRLSLPVRLSGAAQGLITVTVEHGGARKRLSVLVKSRPGSNDQHLSMIT